MSAKLAEIQRRLRVFFVKLKQKCSRKRASEIEKTLHFWITRSVDDLILVSFL